MAIFNGEMLREKASNKVLEEKKVIVGWNCFEVLEEADKLPEPKAPTSMSKDIKLFKASEFQEYLPFAVDRR